MTKYEMASIGSKQLGDSMDQELRRLLPPIMRHNAATSTSFQAAGYTTFAFIYYFIKISKITVWFVGDFNEKPSPLPAGMPPIQWRKTIKSTWDRKFPGSVNISQHEEIAPCARFLIDYALPRAVRKRGNKVQELDREMVLQREIPVLLFSEGTGKQYTINRYERDQRARAACLQHHGVHCAACGIRMEDFYGIIAEGFIHVHHVVPLAFRKAKYAVNPESDLIPLCPNCHAITHLPDGDPFTIEQLRKMIAAKRG